VVARANLVTQGLKFPSMKYSPLFTSLFLCIILFVCFGQAREIEYGKPLPSNLTQDEINDITWLNEKAKAKVAKFAFLSTFFAYNK
jgi:hypothetical protein